MFAANRARNSPRRSGCGVHPIREGLSKSTPATAVLCGRIVGGAPGEETYDIHNEKPELRSRPLKGLLLFESLKGGPPGWKGRIYNPSDGGTYAATVTVAESGAINVRGCIIWPLCRSEIWTRVHNNQ